VVGCEGLNWEGCALFEADLIWQRQQLPGRRHGVLGIATLSDQGDAAAHKARINARANLFDNAGCFSPRYHGQFWLNKIQSAPEQCVGEVHAYSAYAHQGLTIARSGPFDLFEPEHFGASKLVYSDSFHFATSAISGIHSAVRAYDLTCYEARLIAGQKERQRRNFFWLAYSA
jgi:hypothetical protein